MSNKLKRFRIIISVLLMVSMVCIGGMAATTAATHENPSNNLHNGFGSVTGIILNKDATSMMVGDSETLIATVQPLTAKNTGVKWSSSNNKIAKVNKNGTVTGIRPGTATIKARTSSGNFTASCVVTVTPAPIPPSITKVAVAPTTVILARGTTQQLNATVTAVGGAATTVTWSSSDKRALTVDADGVVTVLPNARYGTYTITAASTFDPTKKGTAKITIKAVTPSVSRVSVAPATANVAQGASQQLTATVTAVYGAATTVTWTSSDAANVAVNASGLVTVDAAAPLGQYTITATSTFDATKKGTATINVTAAIPAVTSVTVSPATADVAQGASQQLTATVAAVNGADTTVTWTSSDAANVAVDAAGLVTVGAAAPLGQYTITATSTFDATKNGTATINVVLVTATPVINLPVTSAMTSVSGTAEPGATVILSIGVNAQPSVPADGTTGAWTVGSLTLVVSDAISVTAQATGKTISSAATTTVAAASVAITPISSINAVIGDSVIIPVSATNPNNGMLMYSVTGAPTGLTMTKEGVAYWKPKSAGNYNFNVVVNDMTTPAVSSSVTINVSASATPASPVIEPVALGISKVGSNINYKVIAVDANGDTLSYSLVNSPPGASIGTASGILTWTPSTAGNYTFDISVSDGVNTTTRTVNIAVVIDYDNVTKWNIAAINYLNTKGISNQYGSRTLAMMHTAMFDAVNSISNSYQPYNMLVAGSTSASPDAAAAAAAHTILTSLYPADTATFDSVYNLQMAAIPDGQPKIDGIQLGQATANGIITLRSTDNSASANIPYADGTLPGEYRKTGPMNPLLPGWGNVTPWVLTSGSQFRLAGPPALTSTEYTAAYNETKDVGARTSSSRTTQQCEDALFWIGGVPDHWYGIARELSAKNSLTLEENARLLALLSASLADASIAGWDTKYSYGFWRPVTAIGDGELDGNASTIGEPAWKPFITTPAFPEYGSGHSITCNTGATLLANFFGSDVASFTRTSSTAGLPAHEYTAFSEVAQEAGNSRIPAGVHFSFSNIEALAAGAQIGDYVYAHAMQP